MVELEDASLAKIEGLAPLVEDYGVKFFHRRRMPTVVARDEAFA
jgi:hypothetical protein